MKPLTPVPLTAAAFAPFGDVISVDAAPAKSANQGSATRADFIASLQTTRTNAKPNVAVFKSTPRPLPFDVTLLERHPCSTQLFSPMVVSRYVVLCAPTAADGGIDESGLVAFLASPKQAINYRAGTWHHPLLVLDSEAQFLMLAWEDGTPLDCETRELVMRRSLHVP